VEGAATVAVEVADPSGDRATTIGVGETESPKFPETVRVTFPRNPPTHVIVKSVLDELPLGIDRNAGLAARVNSGLLIVTKTYAYRVTLPPVAWTCR